MLIKDKLLDFVKRCENIEGPKVTICLPTNRKAPENEMDSTVYKNLWQNVKQTLEEKYPRREWQDTLDALSKLSNDSLFWKDSKDGLVVLGCGKEVEIFNLDYQVPEIANVGDSFHLKPLFYFDKIFSGLYLADISKDRISLYEAGVTGVEPVTDTDIKMAFDELFDDFDANSNLNVRSSGMTHGHRARPEEVEKDRDKYFQYLDKEFEKLSKENDKKFIFAGTSENISQFKNTSKGNYYLEHSISKPVSTLSGETLVNELNEALKPDETTELDNISAEVERARRDDKFTDSISEIKEALEQGRVAKIILMEDETGTVDNDADEIATSALLSNTEVLALKRDMVDIKERILAIMRY